MNQSKKKMESREYMGHLCASNLSDKKVVLFPASPVVITITAKKNTHIVDTGNRYRIDYRGK